MALAPNRPPTIHVPPPTAPSGSNDADRKECERILALKQRAMDRRQNWVPAWEDVNDYVFPYREGFNDETPGQRKTDNIYDETAVTGVSRFASRLQLGFFPPNGDAFGLEAGPDLDPKYHTLQLADDLQVVADFFHECLRNSNFTAELHEALQDLAVGTLNMIVEAGPYPGDLIFTAVPATQCALLPGKRDDVGGWFRWHKKMPASQVKATWPKARWSENMTRSAQASDGTKTGQPAAQEATFDILEAVICDDSAGYDQDEAYDYYLICESDRFVMNEASFQGLGSRPVVTARWSKNASEVWGRGPLLQAMPAIKTVNLTVQLILENAEMAIGGAWVYDDDGVFNPDAIVLQPGTFIPRQSGSKVEPLGSAAQFDVAQLILADMRRNIRKALFIDELEKEGSTPISAEEVQQRMRDTARDMGSVAGRLTHEFLLPLVQRIAYIFKKQGILELPKINGREIRLVPTSPLLRVNDQQDVDNIVRYGQTLDVVLGQGFAATKFNRDRAPEWMARKMGVPVMVLNSPAEQQKVVTDAAAAMQAAQAGPAVAQSATRSAISAATQP